MKTLYCSIKTEDSTTEFSVKDLENLCRASLSEEWDEDELKAWDKIISRHKRENTAHFKRSGWDLDFDFIYNDIIDEIMGTHDFKMYVASKILGKDQTLTFKKEGIFLSKNKKKKA